MFKKISLVVLLLITSQHLFSQEKLEKVKGNKILSFKSKKVKSFTSLEIAGEFTVELIKKASPTVNIDTDENLQEFISVSENDGTLKIETTKDLTRYKRLFLEIGFDDKLSEIIIRDKVKLKTKNALTSEKINIETYDNTELTTSFQTSTATIFCKEKSRLKLEGKSETTSINSNDNSKIEGNLTTNALTITQNLKSIITLEGKANQSIILLSDNSFLNLASLPTGTSMLTTSNDADAYINTQNKLTLEASGKTNTYLLGNPLVELKLFKDETTLHKETKAPSTFKTFLR